MIQTARLLEELERMRAEVSAFVEEEKHHVTNHRKAADKAWSDALKAYLAARRMAGEAMEARAALVEMQLRFDWAVPAVLTLPNGLVKTYWPK